MCSNLQRNIYKLYTKIPFQSQKISTDSSWWSNRVKLETWQLRSFRFPQRFDFAGWKASYLPSSETSRKTIILNVGINICSTCTCFVRDTGTRILIVIVVCDKKSLRNTRLSQRYMFYAIIS